MTRRTYTFSKKIQSGESGTGLGPLVEFYSKLPKGQVTPRVSGIKGRFFSGNNARASPVVALIVGLFAVGYTLDYNSAYLYPFSASKRTLTPFHSALEYVRRFSRSRLFF